MRPALRSALLSITGPHRTSNQDAAAAARDFALVADGVGGHAGGDVASRVVTRIVVDGLDGAGAADLDETALRALLRTANDALAGESGRDPRLIGLATTFTGVFCGEDEVCVAHIGDSRAYLVRGGIGSRISHDDSYVQLLVDTGVLDPAEAWQHPQSNLLTQVLAGTSEDAAQLQVIHQHAAAGDRWLLCSDGLTDYVDEPGVLEVLIDAAGPDEAAERLVAAALARDAHDNVTVVVCDVVAARGRRPGRASARGIGAGQRRGAGARDAADARGGAEHRLSPGQPAGTCPWSPRGRPSPRRRVREQAERVALGVEHDAHVVLGLPRRRASAERLGERDARGQVIDRDVQVHLHLARSGLGRPGRRLVQRVELE